jgi:hypothetical protein
MAFVQSSCICTYIKNNVSLNTCMTEVSLIRMSKSGMSEHPAVFFNKVRHHMFSVYEKVLDFDIALEVLDKYKIITPWKEGLKAELIFYDRFYSTLKLDPLLDAGVKADFSGVRNKKMVNFDVTTNLEYKDIDKYADVAQRKGKQYEIALVNTKSEEIQFFPLRFPICRECGLFSHYVLFYSRPSRDVTWSLSTSQALILHCPHCWEFRIVEEYSYYIPSILVTLKDQLSLQSPEENLNPDFDADKFIMSESISAVQSFESETRKLISAFSEGDYIITDPRDADGYFGGRIFWVHPLAERFFGDVIDIDYFDGVYEV